MPSTAAGSVSPRRRPRRIDEEPTFDEAVALYLGRRLLDPLAGTAFGDAARRAAEKVRATLGRAAMEYLDRFAGFFHATAFGAHDYARRTEVIDALLVAIEDGRVSAGTASVAAPVFDHNSIPIAAVGVTIGHRCPGSGEGGCDQDFAELAGFVRRSAHDVTTAIGGRELG